MDSWINIGLGPHGLILGISLVWSLLATLQELWAIGSFRGFRVAIEFLKGFSKRKKYYFPLAFFLFNMSGLD